MNLISEKFQNNLSSLVHSVGVVKNIMRMQIFRTMGRLTFGAYLIHPSILRIFYGSIRQPVYTDDYRMVVFSLSLSLPQNQSAIDFNGILFCFQYDLTISLYVTAYILSFILCLAVELPCSVIQKWIFNRDTKKVDKTIYEQTEPETIKLSKNINEIDNINNKTLCWILAVDNFSCALKPNLRLKQI